MSTEATVPGVKNKAAKVVILVAAGFIVGMAGYALLDKHVMKRFNIA